MIFSQQENSALPLVIGFDSWTGGIRNYQRLLPPIRELGFDFLLIHLGSWGVDKGRPKEERIGDARIRDISYYGNYSFSEILDIERPSVIVFLSTDTFAHRAFNRYCKKKGIPTIHVYHGLMSVLAVESGKPYQRNFSSYFKFVTNRIFKMLTKVWPTYIAALLRTGASCKDWSRFIKDNIDLLIGKEQLESATDARTNVCCIYTNGDRKHAMSRYGFQHEEVISVGNPDIQMFGLDESLIGSCIVSDNDGLTDVMYIDTALLIRGATFSDSREFVEHLKNTKDRLSAYGKDLIVKLHPDHYKTDIPGKLEADGVELCENSQFVVHLKRCCAAIVEPSSAAVIPALMGKPLFMARYGKLTGQSFGSILIEYPASCYLDQIEDFSEKLSMLQSEALCARVRDWIDTNRGPLPSKKMPDHVANVISKLAGNDAH